jgi:hypothetical protein
MAKFDFSKLKQLPPENRIKAIQKLEEELHKLINARQNEIEEAKSLLEEAKHEMQVLEDIETPAVREVEVQKLFESEQEKSIEKKSELEDIAQEASRGLSTEQESYAGFLAQEQSVDQIHNRLYEIRQEQTKTGVETFYQTAFINAAEQAINLKKMHGNYKSGSKSEAMMTASERLIQYLK